MTRVVKRAWIPIVIAVVVAIAGFCIDRLQNVLGSHDHPSGASANSADLVPFNPKHVAYEVFGPAGTVASISYVDVNAAPQRVDDTTLPWSYTVTTTQPAFFANVVAQGDSDAIGCRIIVNGEVKDERSANGMNAQTFCLVKSA
ncbi:MmpS family transport accessory protein [Mycobacterium sp.]|uniref:MmpS family transport accessory protein n=1 Tax=Mycobacterium sp. TaxID=1785 RepID=UPI002D434B26|nr:MmpS family transport accessory protein [Mycobacterium sp.]HZA08904.1 MmpS family transport accessory protein [Mycobacterium sp.]